jgi:tellurite resistance protein TerC
LSTGKALNWVIFWFDLALCFCIGIFLFMGSEKALEFISGYIIEQSLSIDNLFLFIVLFSSFGITPECQRRVLTYGIAGALVLRLIFILLGVKMVSAFHWLLYVFGVILIVSGIRMMCMRGGSADIKDSKLIRRCGAIFPVTDRLEGDKFFVKKNNCHYMTPLFVILMMIELTDIIFAIDSIPAIFSISTDSFIIYTSNIFAILGLRNMYFVLGKVHEKFRYVKYGIALILIFTGIKLTALIFDIYIPTEWSLAVILSLMAGSVAASVAFNLADNAG